MGRRFVFVDESGDLGLGAGASRHITLCAVMTRQPELLDRILKKIRKRRLKKSILRKPELKFYGTSPEIRMVALTEVAAIQDLAVASLTADKVRAGQRRIGKRHEFYRHLAGQLVCDLLWLDRSAHCYDIVFDARPLNRPLGHEFDQYIESTILHRCDELGVIPPRVRVSRFDSQMSGGLQVADYVAGAIQRKFELRDSSYHDIIVSKIAVERLLFGQKNSADPGRIITRAPHGAP
ncbi:MAG: DUF3800 domain-containing protein [Thermoplasmata archaeon]